MAAFAAYQKDPLSWNFEKFGPRPGTPGCKAPKRIITLFGYTIVNQKDGRKPIRVISGGKDGGGEGGDKDTSGTGKGSIPPKAPFWPDINKDGDPKATCGNACVAIDALEVTVRYDDFHDEILIESENLPAVRGTNADHSAHLLRGAIRAQFGFDPGKNNTIDALFYLALSNRFDPIKEYFDALVWDKVPRLENWLKTYLGAEDTELNMWQGKLALVAGVRRVCQPGAKFDNIPVLEGPEGTGKSQALEILAGDPKNFSDQTILGVRDKEQQELLNGKRIYEIAELHGMKRAQIESVKAFCSRTHDRGRPAYGRAVIDKPRRCIMFGTTNDDAYLKSQTGNRRFWPIKTSGYVKLEDLRREADQLWAEAAFLEATGMSLVLPRELWAKAAIEQDKRLEHDPWVDILEGLRGIVPEEDPEQERIFTMDALKALNIADAKASTGDEHRLKNAMKKLGWSGPERMYINKIRKRGYWRQLPDVKKV
jgi:predicted P-loop ATPase